MEERLNMKKWLIRKVTSSLPGAFVTERGVRFAANAADVSECSLLLYRRGSTSILMEIPLKQAGERTNICAVEVCGLEPAKYEYNFRMDGRVVTDPYAACVSGRRVWGRLCTPDKEHSVRGRIPFSDFDWEEDQPLVRPYSETVIYCLHVRGFTKDSSSRVLHRGTFLGVAEKIPYLTDLGINAVELLPCYDFFERNEKSGHINYWGYTPGFYFAPKASYCAADDPVSEFKTMVKSFHKSGIEVYLQFHFEDDTNPVVIQDALRYWTEEYHIDGFHVSGKTVPLDILALDPRLCNIKLMTEWFEEERYSDRKIPRKHLAEYNDGFKNDIRRFIKGDEDQLKNFLYRFNRCPQDRGVINYVAGAQGFTLMDMVSYDRKHNEENGEQNQDGTSYNYSWNCGEEGPSRKKNIRALRTKVRMNAVLLTFLSQGTPMLLSGDEFGNTKYGNNNSYCQDSKVSWLDWNDLYKNRAFCEFVKTLIAFRKEHPVLRREEPFQMLDTLSCGYPDLSYHGREPWAAEFENYSRQTGILYCGLYAAKEGGNDDFIYIGCNMHWIRHELSLPDLPSGLNWQLRLCTDSENKSTVLKESKSPKRMLADIPPRSIVVLCSSGKQQERVVR